MSENRIKLSPDTVAYADGDAHKQVVEFAISGAPTETIDVQILALWSYVVSRTRKRRTH